MKMFKIEWWCAERGIYMQEYYLQIKGAVQRFQNLEMFVKDSNPEITTLHLYNE